jgi:glucose/arabinose dehydrogenase
MGVPNDGSRRMFFVEQAGRVKVRQASGAIGTYLDITSEVLSGGERGLLGIAFHPHFSSNGYMFVYYTDSNGALNIARFQASPPSANSVSASTQRTIITIPHTEAANHNGGQLAFGPDGFLYAGVGDGGNENDPHNYGQNNATLLGKLLRIDPIPGGGYRIPPSNPFAGVGGRRAEIWAYGLRNPWRFSFDRGSGDLIIADVGQDLEEEIDFAAAGTGRGANYGWSVWEGTRRNKPGRAPGAVFPKVVALHREGYCAIIGGYVVRDRSLPSVFGRYLFGDNCRPQIESVKLSSGGARELRATGLHVSGTSSFGEDARGHIYIASLDGTVYRLVQH